MGSEYDDMPDLLNSDGTIYDETKEPSQFEYSKNIILKSATRQFLAVFFHLVTFHFFFVYYIPEWIFPWAVRFDLEEKDLPQTSQECLASPECI